MENQYFTLQSALASKDIEAWVQGFLRYRNDNIAFADGLKLFDRYYIGPLRMPLAFFAKFYDPEEGARYTSGKAGFDRHVTKMVSAIKDGWDVPPLIASYVNGHFELNDGNHRHEALLRCGYEVYYVIIWITETEDYEDFRNRYMKYLDGQK